MIMVNVAVAVTIIVVMMMMDATYATLEGLDVDVVPLVIARLGLVVVALHVVVDALRYTT